LRTVADMALLLRRTLRTATDPKTGRPSKQTSGCAFEVAPARAPARPAPIG
jgi:hypothetical protein